MNNIEEQKSRGQEGKPVSSLHTLAPCGRAKLRTDGAKRVRIAEQRGRISPQGLKARVCGAWSNFKTGQGEGSKSLRKTLSRICKFAYCSLTNSTLSQRERVKSKNAFTLAEVLITLGIIGIVAAMTLPALVQHYRKMEYSSRLKKFYSVMNQAVLASELDNGPAGDWQKNGSDLTDDDGNVNYSANSAVTKSYIDTYIKPYIKITDFRTLKQGDSATAFGEAVMTFADGSYVYVHNGSCVDFHYDVNGPKLPNQYGRDVFHFMICPNRICSLWYTGVCGKFSCRTPLPDSREEAIENCKTSPRYACSELLYMDNFEFKDDYPHKL